MSRRIIESDDDDESPTTTNNNSLGPFLPFLTPTTNNDEYTLDKEQHEEFIQAIPSSTKQVSEHQILVVVNALRHSAKKVRINLFKLNKAHIVFGTWWDHCLSKISSGASSSSRSSNAVKIVLELLKFVRENLSDVIKSNVDLGRAQAKWGVDLVGHVRSTRPAVVVGTNGGGGSFQELGNELELVVKHFDEFYGVEIGNSAIVASPTAAGNAPAVSGSVKNTNAEPTAAERAKAASEKRLEAMKNQQKRRAVGLNSPAKGTDSSRQDFGRTPSVGNSSGYGRNPLDMTGAGKNGVASGNDAWGRPPSAAVASKTAATSGNDSAQWGRAPPSAVTSKNAASSANDSDGWGRPAAAVASKNASASANDSAGWSRASPAAAVATKNAAASANDSAEWGRASSAAATSTNAPASVNDSAEWGRAGRASSAAVTSSNAFTSANYNDGWGRACWNNSDKVVVLDDGSSEGWGRRVASSEVAAATSSSTRASAPSDKEKVPYPESNNSSRNLSHDPQTNRPSYPGSNGYSSKGAYDSQSNRQPHPMKSEGAPLKSTGLERHNSSDQDPSARAGNIRDNQPVGGTGYRNNDNLQQQSNHYTSNRDDNEMHQSRHASHDYDKRDSRAASYQSRSSDRQYDDRRDHDDRRRSDRPSSYRSDSPPSSRDSRNNSRRHDDDRYDDRKRRGRDVLLRGSSGASRCRFFFSERGCRDGASCRFSHDDDDDRKPPADRQNERGSYRRPFEDDRGSEDGEVRPAKRFRGSDNGNPTPNVNNALSVPQAGEAGRGRGRGANVNLPAWMTNSSSSLSSVRPTGAATSTNTQPTNTPLSNADLADVISSVNGTNGSVAPAGRGSGRGNIDNRPAWMTKGANGQSGPTGATGNSAAVNGRFAPPPVAQRNGETSQQGRGRGLGRGTDNRPAWMTRGDL